jgi:hypothetical protein
MLSRQVYARRAQCTFEILGDSSALIHVKEVGSPTVASGGRDGKGGSDGLGEFEGVELGFDDDSDAKVSLLLSAGTALADSGGRVRGVESGKEGLVQHHIVKKIRSS